jgi:hypothetical protein
MKCLLYFRMGTLRSYGEYQWLSDFLAGWFVSDAVDIKSVSISADFSSNFTRISFHFSQEKRLNTRGGKHENSPTVYQLQPEVHISKSNKVFESNSRRTFLILRFLDCSSVGATVVALFCNYGEGLVCLLLLYTTSLSQNPSRVYTFTKCVI